MIIKHFIIPYYHIELIINAFFRYGHLSEEIDDDQMEDRVSEDEVGEGPFRGNVRELRLVLVVDLDAQAGCN